MVVRNQRVLCFPAGPDQCSAGRAKRVAILNDVLIQCIGKKNISNVRIMIMLFLILEISKILQFQYLRRNKVANANIAVFAAARNGNLKQHIFSVHTKEKRFQCNECNYSAYHNYKIKRNITLRHKKDFEMERCGLGNIYDLHTKKHTRSEYKRRETLKENNSMIE